MRTLILMLASVALVGCNDQGAIDGGDDHAVVPEWSACAMKDEAQSCDQLCAAQGMECVPNGCPADPEFCNPEPCDTATQVLALDAEALCADPSLGGYVATTCEAPIDWLFSNTVRCCCAGQD